MSVLDVLALRSRVLSDLSTPRADETRVQRGVLLSSVTVDMAADVWSVLARLGEGLPADALVWPSVTQSRWPYVDRPAVVVYREPYQITVDTQRGEQTFNEIARVLVPFECVERPMLWAPGEWTYIVEIADNGLRASRWAATGGRFDGEPAERDRMDVAFYAALASGALLLASPDRLSRPERRAIERSAAEYVVLRPPRLGDRRPSDRPVIPPRQREHFTADGIEKRALSAPRAAQIVAQNPAMRSYVCGVCGALHVGHSPT